MRISQKLTLVFAGIATLVGVIGFVSIDISQRALQKAIGESSASLAKKTISGVDRIIYYRIEQLQAYSRDLAKQEMLVKSNQEFEQLDNIQKYIDQIDKEWKETPKDKVTAFMEGLINNDLSREIREQLALKEFYKEKYGYVVFSEVFVTNKYGANVAQTGKTSDYKQDDELWWQKTRDEGLYVGDVEYDDSAGVFSINVCIRLDSEDGNFVGIIKAVLNIEEIINIITQARNTSEYGTTTYELVNKEGRVLYKTKDFETLQRLPQEELVYLTGDRGYIVFGQTAEKKRTNCLCSFERL